MFEVIEDSTLVKAWSHCAEMMHAQEKVVDEVMAPYDFARVNAKVQDPRKAEDFHEALTERDKEWCSMKFMGSENAVILSEEHIGTYLPMYNLGAIPSFRYQDCYGQDLHTAMIASLKLALKPKEKHDIIQAVYQCNFLSKAQVAAARNICGY